MPELPEVETMRRGLEKLICGKTIEKVDVLVERMAIQNLDCVLKKQTIHQMRRRGKYLIFELDKDILISHLRMEGKYLLFEDRVPNNKHFHVFFKFSDGSTLVYQDVRKFGTFDLIKKEDELIFFERKNIGPEPTKKELKIKKMAQQFAKSNKMVKSHLLDQSAVAGLGNIYVDEVLWAAKVHPEQLSKTLTHEQIKRIHQHTIAILQLAIEKNGSTIRTYRNALGEDGTMQHYLKVYGKTGQPCARCQTPLSKIKVGGRGTHFCPTCQVL